MHLKKYPLATWILALILGGWCLAGLLGCCGKNTRLDYGRSVTHNLASQIVDPAAGQTVYVSRGQAPDAAVNAYEKYNKSFKAEEKKQTLKLTTEGM